jgi:hypothetical protein
MTNFTYDIIYLLTTAVDMIVKVAIIISLYKYWKDKDAK